MEKTYQLRYPGEVLERYKDRCGDNMENMRALAIALAEGREFLEADMFVGNQKEEGINTKSFCLIKLEYMRKDYYE